MTEHTRERRQDRAERDKARDWRREEEEGELHGNHRQEHTIEL